MMPSAARVNRRDGGEAGVCAGAGSVVAERHGSRQGSLVGTTREARGEYIASKTLREQEKKGNNPEHD